jgi:hypothetical protein
MKRIEPIARDAGQKIDAGLAIPRKRKYSNVGIAISLFARLRMDRDIETIVPFACFHVTLTTVNRATG